GCGVGHHVVAQRERLGTLEINAVATRVVDSCPVDGSLLAAEPDRADAIAAAADDGGARYRQCLGGDHATQCQVDTDPGAAVVAEDAPADRHSREAVYPVRGGALDIGVA